MSQKQIATIGAGLAGLSCALRLEELGFNCQLYEKTDRVGGRVRTDIVDGFQLDRGFQVLLTAYPRTKLSLNYRALKLKAFFPGAQIRYQGAFHKLADPIRRPFDALSTALSTIPTISDKLRVVKMWHDVTRGSLSQSLMARPETSTLNRLRDYGFSRKMISAFFRPFLGGIFLEPDLVTSSRKFDFVMRMFSLGEAALPRQGMEAIPQQLAKRLKRDVLQLNSTVTSVSNGVLTFADLPSAKFDSIVIATEHQEALHLQVKSEFISNTSVQCFYYAAKRSPVKGPWLVLNGDGIGPINNLCVPTELHRSYAPAGNALVSATVLRESTESEVRKQLIVWYGKVAASWKHLQTVTIPQALTLQSPPALAAIRKPVQLSEKLFACGDYLSITSIEGAISSGVRCANTIHQS